MEIFQSLFYSNKNLFSKDALYFDAILATMKGDAEAQGACMINATKLGQLATEYLDDRRNEYKTLEKAVKRDMMARKQDLMMMQEKMSNFATNIKQLLRRDVRKIIDNSSGIDNAKIYYRAT